MQIQDLINGMLELAAGLFVFNHVRVLIKDKKVRGVSILSNVFFTIWGFWNLYYYPFLNQWLSFWGGLSIVIANTVWVVLMFYYHAKEKTE